MLKTELRPSCPVCGVDCNMNTAVCETCGFADEQGIFALWANAEDAQEWFVNIVKPYRMEWDVQELKKSRSEFADKFQSLDAKFTKAFNTVWSAYETLASDEKEKNELIELVKKQLNEHDDVLGEHDVAIRQLMLNHKPPQPQAKPVRVQPPPPTPRKPETKIVNGMIHFGGYDWRVLDKQNGQALLLCDRIIEKRWYHNEDVKITWEGCTLRKYLNGEFYNKNFSKDEKSCIAETNVVNSRNPWLGTDGGRNTTDKIFLLCIDEVVKYFRDSGQLQNGPSKNEYWIDDKYNGTRKAVDKNGWASWWWLRSPGLTSYTAAAVLDGGLVFMYGRFVGSAAGGVRPALWLNL